MPEIPEEERIYIGELSGIVHRQVGTIRRWESDGALPRRLHPKRGPRRQRYWTQTQVYGQRGIIAWMERNDMRPGRLVTDPDKEDEHIEHLRKPKFLNGHHINSARAWAGDGTPGTGKTRAYIIKKLFPRTRYARAANLESALVKLFEANGWYFPPPTPTHEPKKDLTKADLREYEDLERRIQALTK